MIHVIASIRTRDGCRDEYLALFRENVPNVLAEEGCIQYVPCVDVDTGWPAQALDPQRVTVVEKWATMDALKAHGKAPHMADFRKRVGHMVESVALQVVESA